MRDAIIEQTIDEEIEIETTAAAINAVGRIAAPNRFEATSSGFYFWIKRGVTLEENQIVFSESRINGEEIKFYALIDEIKRTSRRADMTEEYDIGDGDVNYEPPFANEGFSYAHAQVLRISPEISTPPIERSIVFLGEEAEAKIAYGFDEISRPMPIGLLKNGRNFAGNGLIDLDYLLGENGGHLNVNGMAGAGTKTSFLLTTIKSLETEAKKSLISNDRLFIVPIILNVKGEDLMWINRRNKNFTEADEADWHSLGIEPKPFEDAEFYEPKGKPIHECEATAYSWSLQDILSEESLPFIFSEEDNLNENMTSLVREIVARITRPDGKTLNDALSEKTWRGFLAWVREQSEHGADGIYGKGTWRAVYRRLFNVLEEGKDIFPQNDNDTNPLRVARIESSPPQVIDVNSLPTSLQRFVVGSILKQVETERKTNRIANLRYVIMLDELNRFAPRGARDEITRLLERIATEMRSQGVIMLGAQQMASQVSAKVIEMASIRVLGRTGAAELTDKIWTSWEKSVRDKATKLQLSEKLVTQPTFRQPMLVKVPLNPWADKHAHIAAANNDKPLEI